MNTSILEKKLDEALENYKQEAHSVVSTCQGNPEDVERVFRNTYYVLTDFKKAIIEYLASNK